MIIPVILAGGSGTRLWPLSRQLHPKQYLPLVESRTLFQETVHRLSNNVDIEKPIVVCSEEHRFMAAEQLREKSLAAQKIILEPVGKSTAPAAYAAAALAREITDDALLLVMPADHKIDDLSMLLRTIKKGAGIAAEGLFVTFGVVPQSAHPGYGYIERGGRLEGAMNDDAFQIKRFVEKPDVTTAQNYLESGKYYWNSGIFMFKAAAYMEELERYNPQIVKACKEATKKGKSDLDFFRMDHDSFAKCPEDSIDCAIMERTPKGAVIPFQAGWDDVGSWGALWNIKGKDDDGNVTLGDVVTHDVHGSYLHSTGRLLAVVGVNDHVIVETPDAVMVSPKNRVHNIKELVAKLKRNNRLEAYSHKKVYRPWGAYVSIDAEERFQVKRITVKPGAILSLQKHYHRAEHWVVVKGTAIVTRGEESIVLKEDESTYIPLGIVHRLENPGKIDLELIEVQTGAYLGEDDIVRFDDVYGRQQDK